MRQLQDCQVPLAAPRVSDGNAKGARGMNQPLGGRFLSKQQQREAERVADRHREFEPGLHPCGER